MTRRREWTPVRRVECPWCKAAPGHACTGQTGQQLHNHHASRFEAAGRVPVLERREPS